MLYSPEGKTYLASPMRRDCREKDRGRGEWREKERLKKRKGQTEEEDGSLLTCRSTLSILPIIFRSIISSPVWPCVAASFNLSQHKIATGPRSALRQSTKDLH